MAISVENRKSFPTRVYFAPHAEGFPLELGTGAWSKQKNKSDSATGPNKSFTISSAVWIQSTNVTDGRTDKRTDGHRRQQRPRLRIASRGNKMNKFVCLIRQMAACSKIIDTNRRRRQKYYAYGEQT